MKINLVVLLKGWQLGERERGREGGRQGERKRQGRRDREGGRDRGRQGGKERQRETGRDRGRQGERERHGGREAALSIKMTGAPVQKGDNLPTQCNGSVKVSGYSGT